MASATDIITYIGVPLAVLGVLPILLKMIKFRDIAFRLYLSVPSQLIPFYYIFVDSLDGGLTVHVSNQKCTHAGPLNHRSRVEYPSRRFLFFYVLESHSRLLGAAESLAVKALALVYRRLTPRLVRLLRDTSETSLYKFIGYPGESLRLQPHEFKLQTFELQASRGLRRPWMEIAWRCGFGLESQKSPDSFTNVGATASFEVDLELDTSKAPPLYMDWDQFVWFALTVSVDLNAFRREEANFTLEDRHKLFALQNTNPKLTLKKKHRHATIMRVSSTEEGWNVRLMVQKDFQYSISQALAWNHTMCFQGKTEKNGTSIFCQKLGSSLRTEFDGDLASCLDPNIDLDTNVRPKAFAAAISWIFYRRGCSPDQPISSIPVSQQLLEVREQSLCFLKKLKVEGHLESRIREVFRASIEDGSPAMETGPRRLFERLEFLISASSYVEGWFRCRTILRRLEKNIDSHGMLSLSDDDMESLKSMSKGLPDLDSLGKAIQPVPPSVPGASDQLNSQEAMGVVSGQASSTFEELRNLFDPYRSPNIRKALDFEDQSSNITLLAHILLASSDWGQLPRTHWPLDENIDASIRKILRLLSRLTLHCCHHPFPPSSVASPCDAHMDNLSDLLSVLKQALEDSEYGIYTARDSLSVTELLNWDKAPDAVYLH